MLTFIQTNRGAVSHFVAPMKLIGMPIKVLAAFPERGDRCGLIGENDELCSQVRIAHPAIPESVD